MGDFEKSCGSMRRLCFSASDEQVVSSPVSEPKNLLLAVFWLGTTKGGLGYFVDRPLYSKNPEASTRLDMSIEVGTIETQDHEAAINSIQATPVDNVSTTWNCQAWIMDALDNLEAEGLFRWDRRGKDTAKGKRQDEQ
ncbi:hypothetical protein QBC46DRAFT_449752 [Diplogelasinospora grovesii]|uniref:Uncharacterized protein n=1 Tax=Diplogelasinospora grovesii TaxID=303347 RepID=A0AAN6N774_9PEZI|nr:hypothetical protein QBC46DRAFT_449752 [Diplogelasinospora grovesii]